MTDALNSHYIIDGILQELTPAQILEEVAVGEVKSAPADYEIVDESPEPTFGLLDVDPARIFEYLERLSDVNPVLPLSFAAEYTRAKIAESLINSIWRVGKFKLEDLPMTVKWCWNDSRVCNMSAFYASVAAAAEYLENLNLSLHRYSLTEAEPSIRCATPVSGAPLQCGDKLRPDPHSWLIYVPFDTSEYRLGGSLLSQAMGLGGGVAPKIEDPDYFVDCYEVVREFVEDGVAVAGVTVSGGGLMKALDSLASNGTGISADISDLMKACDEKNAARILFAEVPGVVIQIRDVDFDYVDAEFLLQDVAFYPLGHPTPEKRGLQVESSAKSGIQTILESLLQNAEGED